MAVETSGVTATNIRLHSVPESDRSSAVLIAPAGNASSASTTMNQCLLLTNIR